MNNTYKIESLVALEDSTAKLSTYKTELANCVSTIRWVSEQTSAHWQSEITANDLNSVLEELNNCVTALNDTIIPIIEEYAKAMNTLIAATKATQSETI